MSRLTHIWKRKSLAHQKKHQIHYSSLGCGTLYEVPMEVGRVLFSVRVLTEAAHPLQIIGQWWANTNYASTIRVRVRLAKEILIILSKLLPSVTSISNCAITSIGMAKCITLINPSGRGGATGSHRLLLPSPHRGRMLNNLLPQAL